MMKLHIRGGLKLLVLILILGWNNRTNAQNEHWFFGINGVGIDFSSGNPVQNNGLQPIDMNESTTVVSDGSGALLFYSDGMEVYDQNHLLMPSGVLVGAGGNSAAQGAVTISHPSNPNRYYLFTADDSDDAIENGLRWHEIDMSVIGNGTPGNPTGDVISADNIIMGTCAEMMTAHGCGDTIWVIAHGKNNADYYAIPVTAAGPQAPIISTLGIVMSGPQLRGTLGFNSTGTKLISTSSSTRILDFDPTTGIITNNTVIPGNYYGSEWSSTDNVIYLTASSGSKELFHYNVATATITSIDNNHFYGEIVTGRDGNLYVGKWVGELDSNLAVISSPNSLIATPNGIGFDKDGWFANRVVAFGLPQNLACPIIICPDTTTSQPNDVCVGLSIDLAAHIVGDPGTWTIKQTPAGANPAILSGTVFDATNLNTDPGIYTLQFKSNNFHPTCDSVTERKIEVFPFLTVGLGNDTAICIDKNITLDAQVGTSWLWNTGATTQTLLLDSAGKFDVVVTNANGCIGRDTITLGINTLPLVDLGNDTAICADSSVTFDAVTGTTWLWSNGDNTQTTTVNTNSEFSVIVTDVNGCVEYDTINLSINTLPIINLGNDTAICADSSITFDAVIGNTWSWNTGATTQTISTQLNGNYTVVVTDNNGCVGYDTISLTINALPVVFLGNDTSICADSSITFDAVVGNTWSWNTGDNTQTTIVNTSGDYDVIVTDNNGCVGYDTINLSINSLPIINLGNDTAICADSTLLLDAAIGSSWLWNTGATTQTITVNTSGNYDVITTDANGCVGYDTLNLSINALPIVNLGNDTAICADSTVIFDASIGVSWLWNTGATTQTISANTQGDYDVIATDINGCVNYDTIQLTINALPVVFLGNDTAICADSTLQLNANNGVNWNWNTGENTQSITVNSNGDYDVIVTDINGCVGYDTISLLINALPIVDLGNDTAICIDSSIVFDANLGTQWNWSSGETTQTINTNVEGNHSVVVTDVNGCVGYDTIYLSLNALPIVDLGNDTTICADSSLTIDAINGINWSWNTGDNTQTITVDTQGDYDVVVKNANGCVNYDTISLSIHALPIVNLGNDTAICADSTLTLNAQVGSSWLWNTNDTTSSITVSSLGTYDVIVTDFNGCVGYDTISLNIDALPIIDLGNDTAICIDSAITLDAKMGSSWIWNAGETTQTITTNTGGTYDVSVTDSKGCVGYDTISILINALPIIDLGNDTSICSDSSIVFLAKSGVIWNWNNGQTTQDIEVITADNYSVSVMDTNGCVGYDTINLIIDALPAINLGPDSSLCFGDSMILYGGLTNVDYVWNPTNNTSDSVIVSTADTYSVVATDTNNCVNYDTITVTIDDLPLLDLGPDSSLCDGDSMVLNAGKSGTNYQWNTGQKNQKITVSTESNYIVTVTNAAMCSSTDTIIVTVDSIPIVDLGNDTAICDQQSLIIDALNEGDIFAWNTGDNSQIIQANTSGAYIVTVTNTYNCSTSDTLNLNILNLPIIDLPNNRLVCDYLSFDAEVSEENAQYFWSNGETTKAITISQAGTYYVQVIDTNNCFNKDTIVVTEGPDLLVEIIADSVICKGASINTTLNLSNQTGEVKYQWNTGENNEDISVDSTGFYGIMVIDSLGCWGTDSVYIISKELPTVELIPDTISMCSIEEARETITIQANHNGEYVEWAMGELTNSIVIDQSGFYETVVYDSIGCTGYDSITIAEYCRPITITLPNIFTPNGDGINDYFVPLETEHEDHDYIMHHVEKISVKILNRWGKYVFIAENQLPHWSGNHMEGGEVAAGTYFWVLEYTDIEGNTYKTNGFVQLAR